MPLLAALAVAVGLAAAYLTDCMGLGFGTGSDTGKSESEAKSEAKSEPEPEPEQKAPGQNAGAGERTVVVDGAQCRIDDGAPGSCEAACTTLVGSKGPVTLDGIAGAHQVVETLRQCLADGKIDVRMKAP